MADTQMLSKYLPKKLYNAAADEDGTDLTAKDALPEDRLDTIEALLGKKAAQTGSTISEDVANLVTLVGDYTPEDTDLATDLTAALGDIDALQAVAPEYVAKFATAAAASAVLTSDTAAVTHGSIVTVNDVTYTFVTALSPEPNLVLIGANSDESLTNLKLAINGDATEGTNYSTDTVQPTDVTAVVDTDANTVTVTATTKGAGGNAYPKSTDDAHLDWDGTGEVFTGGVNGQIGATGRIICTTAGVYCCTDGNKCTIADSRGWKSAALSWV